VSLSEIKKDLNALTSETWKSSKKGLNAMKKKYGLAAKIDGTQVCLPEAHMFVLGELAMLHSRKEVTCAVPTLALPEKAGFASVALGASIGSTPGGLEALCVLGLACCIGVSAGVGVRLFGRLQRGRNKTAQVAAIPVATNFSTEHENFVSFVEQIECGAAASASTGSSTGSSSSSINSAAAPKVEAACGTLGLALGDSNMQRPSLMILSFATGMIMALLGVWWLGYCSSGVITPNIGSGETISPAAVQPPLSSICGNSGVVYGVDCSAGVGVTAAKQAVQFFIGDLDDVTISPRSLCGSVDSGVWTADSAS